MILVIHAHPYPGNSRAGAALLDAAKASPQAAVRSLYGLYPDFDVDALAERQALHAAGLVVLLHPVLWYSAPALLKLWFEVVLERGWAHGPGGNALAGKDCLWVPTTGGDAGAYSSDGPHGHAFEHFAPAIEQTARYCGMRWLPPHVVHAGPGTDPATIAAAAAVLRERLAAWAREREAA